MKRFNFGVLIIFFSIYPLLAVREESNGKTEDRLDWIIEWEDNFNIDSLDPTVWTCMPRRSNCSWRFYSSNQECYRFKDGKLIIRGIKNPDTTTDTARFLIGGIYTKYKKSFCPGRFEIRAKIKSVYGGSASIWLMPFSLKDGWPADGEIDIMEHARHADYITQTVHSEYTQNNPDSRPHRFTKVHVLPNEFNIYSVEIHKNIVIFYVNDRLTLSYPMVCSLAEKGQFPFYKDWYIILNTNLAVNPNNPVCESELPIELEVDWVKYYSKRTGT